MAGEYTYMCVCVYYENLAQKHRNDNANNMQNTNNVENETKLAL